MYKILAEMAGMSFCYALEFEDTVKGLQGYVKPDAEIPSDAACISVGESEYDDWFKIGNTQRNGFAEYSLLGCRTSEYMMDYSRFVFHSVAMRWHDRAWLITAPPGIGKSTQFRNLQLMHPDEVDIINGDKPIVELRDDGAFVHPSPWTGKERWCGAEGAPLGGIIFLKHGENAIEPIAPKDVAGRTFFSIFQSFDTGDVVQKAAKLAQQLLKSVPLWQLTNRGDLASSVLIYNVMKKTIEDNGL